MGWLDVFRNPALDSEPATLRKLQALLPADAVQRLTEQVTASEQRHSGQIRICVEYAMPTAYQQAQYSTRERALALFSELQVWDTEYNNGVLLYLLLDQHAIEIVADRGFNRHVTTGHWAAVTEQMVPHLRAHKLEHALSAALHDLTALLATHFPPNPSQPRLNDLPDAPVLLG